MRKSTYNEEKIKTIALDRAILISSKDTSAEVIIRIAKVYEEYLTENK